MHTEDREVLLAIAEDPEATEEPSITDPLSAARMARVAAAVIQHSEEFDLDGESPDDALPVETYIASYLADVLHLADMVRSGEAKEMLQEAIYFASETPVYDSLRGLKVG